MSLNYFDIMVLDCLCKINGERSGSAVFHLFKGKRSSQTIQDAGLFQTAKYFGMAPKCSRSDISASLTKLEQHSYLEPLAETDTYKVTASGAASLRYAISERPWPVHCHGAYYQQAAGVLWKRLSLLVQVLSNKQQGSRQYIPVTKDYKTLQWVKKYFSRHTDHIEMASSLFAMLEAHLRQIDDKAAQIFVYSLTSHDRIGLTSRQLADTLNEDEWYVYILFWASVHYFIHLLPECEHSLLKDILSDVHVENALTESTRRTWQMVKQGIPIQRIADIRKLKTATIEDHIVEISLHEPAFHIDDYVSAEDQLEIAEFSKRIRTNKIKQIRDGLQQRFSYFQIRLALTKQVQQYD
ncbi:helix-turn-helix domain-containing protein [Bacillus vallismortis]|uniref:helix-turn-helix domain-containing protein n=1 Tax=Bacillus vallismortis TaxID=72361 RepID=UPI00227E9C2A|nr:helix-turn-helix domain-containing protein [Bacillus vallismortis]MCI4136198.1 helix-turn-helix domain-containing protein [Bacillus vallismortis]MCY7892514.1 helix-turn-helix domain-containing protein [Bacillus vallismortis]